MRPTPETTVSVDRLLEPASLAAMTQPVTPVATGFDPLDSVLDGGFFPEELVLLGGRPGVGKTIALVQWARHQARSGVQVIMAHYEHSELALLCHLCLVEIGELHAASDTHEARRAITDVASGRSTWAAAASANEMLADAGMAAMGYAGNIKLLTLDAEEDGYEGLERAVEQNVDSTVLMVDHLGKVGRDRTKLADTAGRLKWLGVEKGITVVASTVVDDPGMEVRRLRMGHLEASAGVSHEADVIIMANDKLSAVSRNHSAFDSTRVHEFRNQLVFSVEKNRRGISNVDVEFTRDYSHRRLAPMGGFVTEQLIDDLLVRE
ncbi:MAG: hypothetical protein OEW42_10140 [Acidimicrobiia bacterium]|nr:hypothetical protein [Acidimicrobiia bacterium]